MAGRFFTINTSGKLTLALGVYYLNTLKLSLGPSLTKEVMGGRREREKMDELMRHRKMNGRRESTGKEGGCVNRCEEGNRNEWNERKMDGWKKGHDGRREGARKDGWKKAGNEGKRDRRIIEGEKKGKKEGKE